MTQVYLPIWALITFPAATIVVALLVGLLAALVPRRTGKELDEWRQREETMRMLRWAADHAIKFDSPGESEMGQAALDALGSADLLQPRDRTFVAAVGASILKPAEAAYDDGDEFELDDAPTAVEEQEPL